MTRTEWFSRAIYLNDEINLLIEKRCRIYSAALKTTPTYSDMPKAPNASSALQNAMDRICEIDDEINQKIDELCKAKCEIMNAIRCVDDKTDRACMKMRFIDMKSLGEISTQIGTLRNSIPFHLARGIKSTKYCIVT